MANIFVLILPIATCITGILWCWKRIKLVRTRCRTVKKNNQQGLDISSITNINDVAIKINDKPSWIETCASMFPILLLVFIIRAFIFEPFQIPSGSMMPTLLVGDFILVEKFSYGIKDPISRTTIIKTGHPKRGDIVVFQYPLNPKLDYIKRIIGLPGDRVSYDSSNKHIMIQPNCFSEIDCGSALPITYSELEEKDFIQLLPLSNNNKVNNNTFVKVPFNQLVDHNMHLTQSIESLDGIVHHILTIPGQEDQLNMYYQQQGSALTEWVVPKDEYFMMGDNRDNSADSRYWGFVPEKNLLGKATIIWMSVNKQENKWPTGIRLNRIGSIH